ncbi:MAG: hypothetical protein KDC87_06630 [Planctomycetes bacterium]|nr:hypothetical protein [Planctomycetota bacterium]
MRKAVILFGGEAIDLRNQHLYLDDTWEWDGNDWRRVNTVHTPGGRHTAMATDATRKQIVLFGGTRSLSFPFTGLQDTWIWDGADWSQAQPSTVPVQRYSHSLTFNHRTGRVMMFGGASVGFAFAGSEAHEWTGSDWIITKHPTEPPLQYNPVLAFDPTLNAVVVHAGSATVSDPTWTWDGKIWTKLNTKTSPPIVARGWRADTDLVRRQIVMVGFEDPDSQFGGQTWTFRNNDWALIDRFGGEYPTFASALDLNNTHDDARDEFVFLGALGRTPYTTAMWALRGDKFVRVHPKTLPAHRHQPVLFYHPPSQRVVLMGGYDSKGALNEVWTWDGKNWALHPLSGKTPALAGLGNAIYDPFRNRLVAYPFANTTWEWDYSNGWNPVAATAPSEYCEFVIDHGSRRVLLVPFTTPKNTPRQPWVWDGRAWTKSPLITPPLSGKAFYSHAHGTLVLLPSPQYIYGTRDYYDRCYALDGNVWRLLPESCECKTLSGAGAGSWLLTYDPSRQRTLATNHYTLATHHLFPRTPYPRPGQSAELDVTYPSSPGQTFWLALSTADWPGIPLRTIPYVGTVRLPIARTPLFDLSVSAGLSVNLDRTGAGYFKIPIPPLTSLVGLEFYAAGVLLGTNGIEAVSNAVSLEVIK